MVYLEVAHNAVGGMINEQTGRFNFHNLSAANQTAILKRNKFTADPISLWWVGPVATLW